MTDEIALLDRASDIIRKGWTQGTYARNEAGQPVGALDKEACQWCLRGALKRADNFDHASLSVYGIKVYQRVLQSLSNSIFPQSLASWNDEKGRTQADVIKILEEGKLLSFNKEK